MKSLIYIYIFSFTLLFFKANTTKLKQCKYYYINKLNKKSKNKKIRS